ncbi:hypothetical protein BaRGS_00012186 [Batillaria attramentaria]|uniref:Protein ABHD18 n=1 Tax=Batillaria attramentaria TaxID=370345 RepID=A0ABD0LAW1_9CAEN
MSRLDQLYRRLLLTKFFTKGWGKPDSLKRLFDFRKIISNRELCRHLVPSDYPVHIEKEYPDGDCRILEGHLISPLTHHLPGIVPKEVEKARLGSHWKHSKLRPVCIHLAGTGDHYFWRRRILMAKPLLKESGIASIILENPFYGSRKPKGQIRSSLHNVSDLFVMGGALILESLALLHWCQRQGYGPLGITGISMGGHMASLAATNWHEPLSLIPCLSWSTASAVFTQGVMSEAIPWKTLETQFFENSVYQDEISQLLISPEEHRSQNAYALGQQFVKDFSRDFENLQQMHKDFLHKAHHKQAALDDISAQAVSTSQTVIKNSLNLQGAGDIHSSGESGGRLTDMINASLSSVSNSSSAEIKQPSLEQSTPQRSAEALTLQHAVSKSKLSRAQVSSGSVHKTDVPLQHALSKSKLSRVTRPSSDSSAGSLSHTLQQVAVNFMVGVMDECTHLGNFSMPVDPRLIIIVTATQDAYVPRQGVIPLDQLWPGCEVRYLTNRGHIAAFLLNNDVFRKAIADSFDKQIKLYYQS